MSDSVQPHRWQPIRLPRPWDSPGKNTGVGCHFLLQSMKVKSESEVAQSSPTLRPHGLHSTRLLLPWDFPGKSTGVGCHCLLLEALLVCFTSPCIPGGCDREAACLSHHDRPKLSDYPPFHLQTIIRNTSSLPSG